MERFACGYFTDTNRNITIYCKKNNIFLKNNKTFLINYVILPFKTQKGGEMAMPAKKTKKKTVKKKKK